MLFSVEPQRDFLQLATRSLRILLFPCFEHADELRIRRLGVRILFDIDRNDAERTELPPRSTMASVAKKSPTMRGRIWKVTLSVSTFPERSKYPTPLR